MRGIDTLAGFGTLIFLIGIFCFKALFTKKTIRENLETVTYPPLKNSSKFLLIFFGCICILLGSLIILRSFDLI